MVEEEKKGQKERKREGWSAGESVQWKRGGGGSWWGRWARGEVGARSSLLT